MRSSVRITKCVGLVIKPADTGVPIAEPRGGMCGMCLVGHCQHLGEGRLDGRKVSPAEPERVAERRRGPHLHLIGRLVDWLDWPIGQLARFED